MVGINQDNLPLIIFSRQGLFGVPSRTRTCNADLGGRGYIPLPMRT